MLSIMDWMRDQRVDARNVERQFCDWTGMTPKRYARVIRFKHSYHRLLSGAHRRGASGLHLDGYYDQSHFHREFRFFTGVAPGAMLCGDMDADTSVTDHLLAGEFAAVD
jgi:methylphosphotriester-DNA--protein-cysteine methyltransferase